LTFFFVQTDIISLANSDYQGNFDFTTTQSVVWNIEGAQTTESRAYIVDSRQLQWGYAIGTKGELPGVKVTPTNYLDKDTSPEDLVEGMGLGDTLDPQSLYKQQLAIRMGVATTAPTQKASSSGLLQQDGVLIISTVVLSIVAIIGGCAFVALFFLFSRKKEEVEEPLLMNVSSSQQTKIT